MYKKNNKKIGIVLSKQIWASSWISAHSSDLQTGTMKRLERHFHTPETHSIPEIACIICFVAISRSSSVRCARLSTRAMWAWGAGCCLPLKSLALSLLARSRCSASVSVASPGEEAALDTSSATNSADITITFPDMSVYRKGRKKKGYICSKCKIVLKKRNNKRIYLIPVWRQYEIDVQQNPTSLMFVVHGEQIGAFIPISNKKTKGASNMA